MSNGNTKYLKQLISYPKCDILSSLRMLAVSRQSCQNISSYNFNDKSKIRVLILNGSEPSEQSKCDIYYVKTAFKCLRILILSTISNTIKIQEILTGVVEWT